MAQTSFPPDNQRKHPPEAPNEALYPPVYRPSADPTPHLILPEAIEGAEIAAYTASVAIPVLLGSLSPSGHKQISLQVKDVVAVIEDFKTP